MAGEQGASQPSRLVAFVQDVLVGRHWLSKAIPPVLWLVDAVLCALIIWRIPYTEIDWVAYMEQVEQFIGGERDYSLIKGGTGPLVYPAAHVYIYTALYYVTDRGRNIFLAQQIFAVLYMATLGLVMLCYSRAKVPPYVFPLLILSKRLHSVFVLRCFNDCFAAFFLWLAIYCFQRRAWTVGSLAYSVGLGVKMSLLLALPAVAVVLFLGRGFRGSIALAWLMAQVQLALSLPFVAGNWRAYLGRAFELSRQFQFQWTVNWRMLGEHVFLSRAFSAALLAGHAALLLALVSRVWLPPAGQSIMTILPSVLRGAAPLTERQERHVSARVVTPDYVLSAVLSANVAGLLCARSLHYQFYAYLAWATPFLWWRASGGSFAVVVGLWAAQEWAWNVFPSTSMSSAVVVGVLATTVLMSLFSKTRTPPPPPPPPETAEAVRAKDR